MVGTQTQIEIEIEISIWYQANITNIDTDYYQKQDSFFQAKSENIELLGNHLGMIAT